MRIILLLIAAKMLLIGLPASWRHVRTAVTDCGDLILAIVGYAQVTARATDVGLGVRPCHIEVRVLVDVHIRSDRRSLLRQCKQSRAPSMARLACSSI